MPPMIPIPTIERYVGLPYRPGEFDCADLVQLVQRELFGREIRLPQDRNRPSVPRAMAREIARMQPAIARERPEYAQAETGDGVLLLVGELPLHIGVWFRLPAEDYVLHNDREAMQSVLTRWRDLRLLGFRVGGIYEWL